MNALVLAIIGCWICSGAGRTLLGRFTVLSDSAALRFVYSAAIGLGIAAYAIFTVGLCGRLSFWPVMLVWLALAAIGVKGMAQNARDVLDWLRGLRSGTTMPALMKPAGAIAISGAAVILLLTILTVIACFKPPGRSEWDAVAYHLADPAQFLAAHRVYSLPTEHHSNFPLLMEMLYTAGLLYNGFALANLTHLATAALTGLAIFATARRLGGSICGWAAVVLYASTPVVLWESPVAYVEMGQALFTTLSILAAIRAVSPGANSPSIGGRAAESTQWIILCAVCSGFALGVKYLALVPFGLIFLYLAMNTRSIRKLAVYAAVALAIASPWYVKNVIVMHNPVYPYLFKVFPHSLNWTASRAAGYESEQQRFGTVHSLKQPAAAAANLLQAPWDIVTLPLAKPGTYSNEGEFSYMTLVGGLCFALSAVLLLRRRVNPEVVSIALFGIVQLAAWFFVAQVSRYMVSILPLFAISGAYAVFGYTEQHGRLNQPAAKILSIFPIWLAGLLIAAQVGEVMWIMLAPPPHSNIVSIPSVVEMIQSPDGGSAYLRRHLDTYAISDWINRNSAQNDGVLLYDDTIGFYIRRPYMWANEEHSGYIPYSKFTDGADLTRWMVGHGYRYAMFDMNWAPQRNDTIHNDPQLADGPGHNEALAFQNWYSSAELKPVGYKGYRWRGLVADAYRRGLWTDAGVARNGVMLLRIGAEPTR